MRTVLLGSGALMLLAYPLVLLLPFIGRQDSPKSGKPETAAIMTAASGRHWLEAEAEQTASPSLRPVVIRKSK